MADIGIDKLGYSSIDVKGLITKQSPDIAMGVDKGGAGDQGIMYGYATNETPELLPTPFAVATKFIKRLEALDCPMLMPDAKAQVSFDYDEGRITTFLCSVQHSEDATLDDIRKIIESLMVLVASEYGLNTDFEKLINPTGRFVVGGSKADCGVTGRKLACDTYGGIARIGGGALSGKDPSKVDRSAAYMARRIAVDLVRAGYCDEVEIQIAYAIGKAEPVSVVAETFGTAHVCPDCIDRYIKASRYNVKGRKYIGTPLKYYFEDVGLRNARLGFRQIEETHIMENIVYNELRSRGYSVDVGVVEKRGLNSEGKTERAYLEIDFIANLGSKRYYIQSAFSMPTEEKRLQEKASLVNVNDSFKKIILVKDVINVMRDEDGITTMSIYDFLMKDNSLEL